MARRQSLGGALQANWRVALYAVVLMTAFNFLSHGTQDLYPTFLQLQRGLSSQTVGAIAIVYNFGALFGGIACGLVLSKHVSRQRIILVASLLSMLVLPLWAFGSGPVLLAIGAFFMQVIVQGAWSVIPAHLDELSSDEARATVPTFIYQLGGLFASANAVIQVCLAEHFDKNYGLALALVVATAAIVVACLAPFGREVKSVSIAQSPVP